MTREEKDKLLKYLCMALPHGVICQGICEIWDNDEEYYTHEFHKTIIVDGKLQGIQFGKALIDGNICNVETVKPYLRPLSSMTEEEKKELKFMCDIGPETLTDSSWINGEFGLSVVYKNKASICVDAIDWLNKKMFDYRDLIPNRLALVAPEGMYENESDSVIGDTTKITVGCKIRSKTNPDVILSIISDDCHEDEFECSNGSVLSLKQIKKHYDLYIEENNGTIVLN